ncbi:M35 family metallo-endopeptidase [Paraburkholderia monticola]|uniref:M35 family metallo-endopeptidase n=1 Tax=Paraburkholderia monticola TaxID=1399968 RepID=UPI00094FE68D|nr:M35 family metallo-endopeptidase [Paraburkholderia monticola]
MNDSQYGFRSPTEDEDDEWVLVHHGAVTNTNPGSLVEVTINTRPICSNMTNKEFRKEVMRARDVGVELVKRRIEGLARWDVTEQERVTTFFARADESTRRVLSSGLSRLVTAMQELVPEKIIRWDSKTGKALSCGLKPTSRDTQASVCRPDSEKRIIVIHTDFCKSPFGLLRDACKIKTMIHECTHFTDTFNSRDIVYGDRESGLRIWANNHPDEAIENADSITGYIATFDKVIS